MDDSEYVMTEEQVTEMVAEALNAMGFSAASQNTGGAICCVVLERKGGGEIIWGTADMNWGASVTDKDGQITSSIETTCSSDSQDIAVIVEAIKNPSIEAGAKWMEN